MRNRLKRSLTLIYWFIFRPKTLGVKCILENNGEVLMIKNSYGGWYKWMFPGGGVDKNETPEQAVKREVLEEVEIEVKGLKRIGKYASNKEFKRDTVIVFSGKSKNKEIGVDPKEIAEARWFKLHNMPEVSEYSKLILSMLKNNKGTTLVKTKEMKMKNQIFREKMLAKILSLIKKNPGIRPRDLNRLLNREHSASLRSTLINRGLIRKERKGSAVFYYPTKKSV